MGPVSVRQALACSQNIPAMRVLDTFGGPSRLLKLLENLGIRGIQGDAAHYGLGLAIGNAEVTLRDLTGAYACLARGGSFLPPEAGAGCFRSGTARTACGSLLHGGGHSGGPGSPDGGVP